MGDLQSESKDAERRDSASYRREVLRDNCFLKTNIFTCNFWNKKIYLRSHFSAASRHVSGPTFVTVAKIYTDWTKQETGWRKVCEEALQVQKMCPVT